MESGAPSPFDKIGADDLDWEHDDSLSHTNHCIAGSIAGVVEHVLLLPLDNIKTHMQVFKRKIGILETAKYIKKIDGIKKFWNGASIIASGCMPAHAAYFSVYELSKRKLLTNVKQSWHPYIYGFTGLLATLVHDCILTPIDMLKQRSQVAPSHMRFGRLVKYIIKQEGALSLYRSFPITLFMNLPTAIILVGTNENLKVLFDPKGGHTYFSWFLCAGLAGGISSTLTIPMDVIKTKLQTQNCFGINENCSCPIAPVKTSGHDAFCPHATTSATTNPKILDMLKKDRKSYTIPSMNARFFVSNNIHKASINYQSSAENKTIVYRGISATTKLIFKEEGLRGFTKGLLPRVVTQAPSAAISWTTYELVKKLLLKNSNKH